MATQLLNTIVTNLTNYSTRNAFFINNQFYSYAELAAKIAGITEKIKSKNIPTQTTVGIITTDSLETYASIISLWLNEMIFVPISPNNSKERNQSAIEQAEIEYILAPNLKAAEIVDLTALTVIETEDLTSNSVVENHNTNPNNILYLLFTSGSTGVPKGVPISQQNLTTFIIEFMQLGYELNQEDKFLQLYDLSFDASVHCYTLPLFLGGCIYTIPTNEVKYLYAYKLMKEQELTFVKMPPSTITYLQPYFSKINLEQLKYTLFGGEALPLNLANDWATCAPNSKIHNVYGPTEATINCFYYEANNTPKAFNSIVSIGKPIGKTIAIVLDENNNPLTENNKGELCVAGNQITKGYWKNSDKNKTAFIKLTHNNQPTTFYKTGDLVYFDENQDYFYCGRIDNQVQIQGYRVELGEIEHLARLKTNLTHVVALAKLSSEGANQIHLFLENYKGNSTELKIHLSEKLPLYMVPQQIINLDSFPLLTSGKVDTTKLKELI